jgi:amino acid transporter
MKDEQGQQPKLKPTLGLFDATAISVGAIMGAGTIYYFAKERVTPKNATSM